MERLLWYVAYGSNCTRRGSTGTCAAGGRPAGCARTRAAETGRATLGPGRYETLLRVGERDGLPMLTFTAPHAASEVEWAPPAPVYLGMLARGLREAHGWDVARTTDYLAARPGVAGHWSRSGVRRLVVETSAP